MQDKITIVTICYNAEKTIQKTMDSVLKQNYDNIQYIIKDGNSSDNTNEIIDKNKGKFAERNIELTHIICNDKGIFDAMNQAIDIATGKWINFMNSDDIFATENVISDIFENKTYNADILYGNSICEYEFFSGKKEYALWKGDYNSFPNMPFSHQACFISTKIMKEKKYDTTFKIGADYNFLLECYVEGKEFFNVGYNISICTMDGVSNSNVKKAYFEICNARKKNGIKYDCFVIRIIIVLIQKKRELISNMLDKEKKAEYLRKIQMKNGMCFYDKLEDILEHV